MSTHRISTWREREMQKERQKQEATRVAADEAQRKKIAKTEENFPTTLQLPTSHAMPLNKFVELAKKWQIDEATMNRLASTDEGRSFIREATFLLRSRGAASRPRYTEYAEEEPWIVEESLDDKFPPHGRRGTYTAPDEEGWRLVTRKARQRQRELTEAELARRWRNADLEGQEEDQDVNEDLTDRIQRRSFY